MDHTEVVEAAWRVVRGLAMETPLPWQMGPVGVVLGGLPVLPLPALPSVRGPPPPELDRGPPVPAAVVKAVSGALTRLAKRAAPGPEDGGRDVRARAIEHWA